MEFEEKFEKYAKSIKPNLNMIHWYDLYDGHYVNLKPNFQQHLFQLAIKKAGNYSKLSKEVKINRRVIAECFKLNRTGRCYDLAGAYLKDFVNQGIIKKIKREIYIFKND